jgi:catechol 2,3-dioxygenase-like lactoylglutathione lyase family enzyme
VQILSATPYLRVSDIERSLRFYCDGLGFAVAAQLEEDGRLFWARLEKDGMSLMLSTGSVRFMDGHGHEEDHEHDEAGRHIYQGPAAVAADELNNVTFIYVENADAAFAELKTRGIVPVDEPSDKDYGLREFLTRDPDGYYYAIAHRL